MNITVKELIEGSKKTTDIEFGWIMIREELYGNGHPLAVRFGPKNIYCYSEDDYDAVKNNKEKWYSIIQNIKDIGINVLKSKSYDRFILYNRLDQVGTLENAKKYFHDHNVNDINVDELYNEMNKNKNMLI